MLCLGQSAVDQHCLDISCVICGLPQGMIDMIGACRRHLGLSSCAIASADVGIDAAQPKRTAMLPET